MRFKVSDKVLRNRRRMRGGQSASKLGVPWPKRGIVYVVRAAWLTPGGVEALQFVGFPDALHPTNGQPCGFDARGFDKLEEVKAITALKVAQQVPITA